MATTPIYTGGMPDNGTLARAIAELQQAAQIPSSTHLTPAQEAQLTASTSGGVLSSTAVGTFAWSGVLDAGEVVRGGGAFYFGGGYGKFDSNSTRHADSHELLYKYVCW